MSATEEKPVPQETPAQETPAQEPPAQEPAAAESKEESLEKAQVDGSGPPGNGSTLADTEFVVEVKLADLQADPNNPLFSAKSFEELQL
jgi:ATP-dependent RNA helicase DDX19/DBP5